MAENARLLNNASERFACNTFAAVFNRPRVRSTRVELGLIFA